MEKLILLLFFYLITYKGVNAQQSFAPIKGNNPAGPVAEFEKILHDFGTIPKGNPVTVSFLFKNTGAMPLMLSEVKTSCGCTTPFYTKDSVMPGKSGQIKVQYNAAAAGAFTKNITVKTNAGDIKVLTIKGTVKAGE